MKTISERIREEKLKAEKEEDILEVYEKTEEIKSTKEEEKPVIPFEEMTKDELNDYAVELGFKNEIKGWWTKKKIIDTLEKLLKGD